MPCLEFYNILQFLHCCSNTKYPSKCQPGYDPKKKLGKVLTILQEQFAYIWIPKQHLSIDEGMIPFKGQIHTKVYNPNKPDKYGMKPFKLCGSSGGCLKFDLYVGKTSEEVISKNEKVYDLVMHLLDGYKKLGYIVFMDNFHTGPDLFHDLLIDEQTAACGTMQPERGVPKKLTAVKFKQWGGFKVMSYNHKMIGMTLFD